MQILNQRIQKRLDYAPAEANHSDSNENRRVSRSQRVGDQSCSKQSRAHAKRKCLAEVCGGPAADQERRNQQGSAYRFYGTTADERNAEFP